MDNNQILTLLESFKGMRNIPKEQIPQMHSMLREAVAKVPAGETDSAMTILGNYFNS